MSLACVIEQTNAQQPTVAMSESVLSVCASDNSACAHSVTLSDTASAVSFFAFYFYNFYFYYLNRQRKQAVAG
jgi:hypothetical protein